MNKKIRPIFIIGSARNGTTNLENSIAALPQVAGVEHWLHYGSHESNLYKNKKYWGDLSDTENYINFLYQYSSSDYFALCKGDVEYHLNHKRDDFYSFFFDLMDNYTRREGKEFWITKLDQKFFLDPKEREVFFNILHNKYENIKIIRIKRNFKDGFKSYINMEGQSYRMRQQSLSMLPALLLQASRHVLTYDIRVKELHDNTFEINFENYIKNREKYVKEVAAYLNISVKNFNELPIDRYQVNTSFVQRSKKELPGYVNSLIPLLIKTFKSHPVLAKFIWKVYYQSKKKPYPLRHRIIYYKYFREQLMRELHLNKATGLLEKIRTEGTTSNGQPEKIKNKESTSYL
jgi:hypothetical protein